jgi:hypothetical protein
MAAGDNTGAEVQRARWPEDQCHAAYPLSKFPHGGMWWPAAIRGGPLQCEGEGKRVICQSIGGPREGRSSLI